MDKLVTGLGPAFAAGLAVQRLLEVFDLASSRSGPTTPDPASSSATSK